MTKEEVYLIDGMTCASCALTVEKAVQKLPATEKATVNLATEKLTISYQEQTMNAEDITKVIADAGYQASLYRPNQNESLSQRQERQNRKLWKRFLWSALLTLPVLYVAMGSMLGAWLPSSLNPNSQPGNFALLQLLFTLPVLYLARDYYKNGFTSLFRGHPNMDSLVALATSFAFGYSLFATLQIFQGENHYHHSLYFESVLVILTLITLGNFFENKSKSRTSQAIQKLLSLKPNEVRIVKGEKQELVPLAQVSLGDHVMIKPGEKIPVDGRVVSGQSYVDEAMLTGESVASNKQKDSLVYTGTINGHGNLIVEVTKRESESFLAQIISLVETAQGSKAPIAKIADQISGIFVPIVILLAILTGLFWLFIMKEDISFSLTSAIAVLIIACPCALGLATPTAIMVGSGRAAENGILFKEGAHLENLANIRTLVFDKTGTITQGRPQVSQIVLLDQTEKTILQEVASLESLSEHPLSQAILAKAEAEEWALLPVRDFTTISGQGLKGEIKNHTLQVGNRRLMTENGVIFDQPIEEKIKALPPQATIVYVAKDYQLEALILIEDQIKTDSQATIDALKDLGIKLALLTGDQKSTAKVIAQKVGIEEVYSEVLPTQKAAIIESLQANKELVAMVGDGINDAPALAVANLGIAIGSGTDIAIESADIILMHTQLTDLLKAISLSRQTIRVIKENLFWAFIYNILMIPIAMGVLHLFGGPLLNPMLAAMAMSLSSISVVLNALRLKTIKL
ncbi:heavy metal translocating P-type ATPase [Streptococcus porcinus]|uniref:P-type Cu(+) transporter n=1 Tax=Streptococcus porcinus TaxID=1340 RepID=A0A7V9WTL5_STRPO|nr:heavy metal translocating P-type ATPase [Streptococcus porcinus]MBA2796855.1 copper-translocating P-type ATPase [Streptococcus porcinus]